MTGRHPHDEVGSPASVSVTVVCAMPHGTVEVSLTRYNIKVMEQDELVVELWGEDELFDDVWASDELVSCCV